MNLATHFYIKNLKFLYKMYVYVKMKLCGFGFWNIKEAI